ncbi:roadblock/LC7 domain-containing protein [Streptomyces sp. NPDC059918]|uniref:roadblock/LC7 domain-containing protein n=1 Tax=unclassified Streptomyces TaxID=2593676 RepID=UPI00364A742B
MADAAFPAHNELDWLIRRFVEENPQIEQAVVVSSDGVLLAHDGALDETGRSRIAAVTAGIAALAASCAELSGGGGLRRTLVELGQGCLLVCHLTDGALLAVHASEGCDLALLGYQSARLARRAGAALTPAPRGGGQYAALPPGIEPVREPR